ncbi:MAG: glycosyltransferase family 4 protein [Amylibacter sp.]|nr:glycosyltransferase family 4 protein [Amylibacter sp.]
MPEIAFYAPMKPPTHPTPSGDRAVARGVLQALGDKVELVSELRIYDGKGDQDVQTGLIQQAEKAAEKLIAQGRTKGWKLWFTYHNYYKAPDLIGPKVSKELGIPYVLLEATRAKKRLDGPWAYFARLAEKASDAANVIFYFTKQDQQALETYRAPHQQIVHLPPFLTTDQTTPPRPKRQDNRILCVGMMRAGAKFASYALIAQVLKSIKTPDWKLVLVGDGPMRTDVETLFQPFGNRVRFLGQQDKSQLETIYNTASVFLWPGVDEAFGMVYLEAQAAGLPVVAQNRPGLRDVIAPTTKLSPIDQVTDMADQIDRLLTDAELWQSRSQTGMDYIRENHLLGAARKNLMTILTPLIGSRP